MKRFLTLFKIEGKLALRCPDGIIFGVIMPVGILFLIGFIAKDQQAGNSGYTLPQNQQYLCMSNLRTRVAIISQIRK